jgi:hypothetical protein
MTTYEKTIESKKCYLRYWLWFHKNLDTFLSTEKQRTENNMKGKEKKYFNRFSLSLSKKI